MWFIKGCHPHRLPLIVSGRKLFLGFMFMFIPYGLYIFDAMVVDTLGFLVVLWSSRGTRKTVIRLAFEERSGFVLNSDG